MSGATLGLLIGGIAGLAVLLFAYLFVQRATRKEIDDSDVWNEIYRKEEDLEYPELFADMNFDEEPGADTAEQKKKFYLSRLIKKLREAEPDEKSN